MKSRKRKYPEGSHASQYAQLGKGWYTNFVSAELVEIERNPFGIYNPYGKGDNSHSPVIALGEAWGYHMGHFLAEQRYGTTANCQIEQNGGIQFCSDSYTHHPHIDVLEYFKPTLGTDPFRWIPKGIFWDLIDDGEPEYYTQVIDQVSGYTIQQIFGAYQSDITTPQQYRDRLLQQNNNNQALQVATLFQSYNY